MSKDEKLEQLKKFQQTAFQNKQDAYDSLARAKQEMNRLYDLSQVAWKKRSDIRDEMNREFEKSKTENDAIWAEYKQIRDYNNSRFKSLKSQADNAHKNMQEAFARASWAFENGDKASSPTYAAEGHRYKSERDQLNSELKQLGSEVKAARTRVESHNNSNFSFNSLKNRFDLAKSEHIAAENNFKAAKEQYSRTKSNFEQAKLSHKNAEIAFQAQLTQLKHKKDGIDKRNEKTLMAVRSKMGWTTGWIDGKDAKIVPRHDNSGTVDIYFGGIGGADGLGHGHIVVEDDVAVTYMREPFQAKKDANINDRRSDDKHTRI